MPLRRLLLPLLALAFGLVPAAAVAQLFGGSSPSSGSDEKGVLASLISRALSTPASRVSVGAVEGALSSDATIRDVEIADRDGVWLRLDRARIVWRRLALLQRRLEVDRLEIGTLDIRRRPVPAEGQVPGENEPLLPELPVKVEIKAFALEQLMLGEPLIGTAARLGATGNAKLGNPAEGLDLTLDTRRLDRPGTLTVRLSLVPEGQRLSLKVAADEPQGGIVAKLARMPGEPPVKLDIDGQGTLDAFKAALTFDAGPGIGATGSANLVRAGTARQLALDLQARIEGLLPDAAAPIFAGTTRLNGNVAFADDSAVQISNVSLVAAAARLDVNGTLSRDQVADLTIAATSLPSADGKTSASGVELKRLALQARVTGPVSGPTVDANLALDDARLPIGRLGRVEGVFKTAPAGEAPGGAKRLSLAGDVRATGIALADAAQARALGDSLTATLRGTATTAGVLDLDQLQVATPTFRANYAGRIGSDEIQGRATTTVPSLRPFRDISGLALAGQAEIAADLEGTPRANRINARIDGNVRSFATGIAAVDGLFAGNVSLAGTARLTPDGTYGFENLRLAGPGASATVNGTLGQEAADLAVAAEIPNIEKAEPRLKGRANLTAKISGGIQKPNVEAQIALTNGSTLGRPIPRLALDLVARDLRGALDARVRLDGEVDRRPARGTLHVARPPAGGTVLDDLDIAIGSAKVAGAVTLDAANLASGRLSVNAPNLDDLSPLLLAKATGSVVLDLALDASNGGQGAKVKADLDRVSLYGVSISKADADLTLQDLYRRPVVDGRVAIDEASVGGERISRIRLTAQGTPQASNVILTASARGFDLDSQARVLPGDRTRIEIARLGATRGAQRLALAGPATVTIVPGGADLRGVAVALGAGRITVDGLVGSRLDLRAEARAVPLAAAEIFAPGLGLAGTFEGEARIGGSTSAPNGEYRARVNGLVAPQTRNLGLPRIDVTASGRLAGGRSTIDAEVAAGRAGSLRITGSVPAGGAGALDLDVRGNIDAGAATTSLLAAGGRRLTGKVAVDARVGGTLAAPQASGSAALSGGTFSDAAQGIQFNAIGARVVARGDDVTIENASARTRNGGSVTASGRVRLDPAAGFPGEIRLAGSNAELVRSSLVTAVANLNLALTGALARDPRVVGRVDLQSVDVRVPESLPGSLKPLPGTKHKNPTRTTRARLAADAKAKGKGGGAPFDATLDVTVAAAGRVFVRGRGLNSEFGGDLRITGRLSKPIPNGALSMRRGSFQILNTRLDFSRGRLSFAGDLTPEIDFQANTNAGGAAIEVAVTGPANEPQFSFTSSPSLPQDEVLSRLLFNVPSGQLSPFQALSLAQAAATFAGGDDQFEGLRRDLGFGGDGGAGPLGDINRALGDRVSVGVTTGTAGAGVGVDVRVTDEIRVKGDFGATGGGSVGIGAQYEW